MDAQQDHPESYRELSNYAREEGISADIEDKFGKNFTIIKNSTFANGEVKEFKEVREVKVICFIAKYTTKKAIGYNF